MRYLFMAIRLWRDYKAVRRGRIAARLWNRGVSWLGWKFLRKLYQ